MKAIEKGRLFAVFAFLAVFAAGCAQTPLQRAEGVERSLGLALDAAHVAVDAKLIKTRQHAETLDKAQKEANAFVAEMTELTIKDGSVKWEFYVSRASSAVARLMAAIPQEAK